MRPRNDQLWIGGGNRAVRKWVGSASADSKKEIHHLVSRMLHENKRVNGTCATHNE